jgi:hypothetical protein
LDIPGKSSSRIPRTTKKMKRMIKRKRPRKRSPSSSNPKLIVITKRPEVGTRNIRKVVEPNGGL